MASQIVHKPVDVHNCKPGWTSREITEDTQFLRKGMVVLDPPKAWDYPAGAVVECDCGKTYVSLGAPIDGAPGIVLWRNEGKWERRRRERRARRG